MYYSLDNPRSLRQAFDDRPAAATELGVTTLFSAVSPGTELAAFNGLPPLRQTANPYPRLVGYCNVGKVTAVPSEVSDYSVGDLVLTHASHCSHFGIAPAQVLATVPAGADLPAAATTYLFHLGYAAVLKGEVRPGHDVAVIGLGTLGLTSAGLAHRSGAKVTGFSDRTVMDSQTASFGLRSIKSKTEVTEQFDVVITTANCWADWRLALTLARRGGRIVVLGFPGRGEPLPDFNPLASQWLYDKQLTITACGHTPGGDIESIDARFTLKRNCAYLLGEVLEGRLPAKSLIAEVRPASELANVYAELTIDRRQGRTIVLDWTGAT